MAVNEVIFNGETVLSTRNTTVNNANLLENETAIDNAGEQIVGALSSQDATDVVRFDTEQSLTNTQKERARNNIGAGSVESFNGRGGAIEPISGDYDASMIEYGDTNVDAELNGFDLRLAGAEGDIDGLETNMLKKEDAMVLLWKNPSPSSSTSGIEVISTSSGITPDFARLDEFTFFKIYMRANTSSWCLTEHIVKKRSSADDVIPLYNYWVEPDSTGSSNFFGVMTRPCKIISNKIYIGSCYDRRINGNSGISAKTARTSDFIPYAVYGIPGLT